MADVKKTTSRDGQPDDLPNGHIAAKADVSSSVSVASVDTGPKARWWQFSKYTDERMLVLKLDIFILSWACFGYFIRLLDTTNMTNAYVSGMKEDLGLYSSEFNLFSTFWVTGYTIGMIPSQALLTYIPRPSIWLPALEFSWAMITFCFAAVRNAKQIYAMRFVIGLLESPFYVGVMTLLGNWYTPKELASRTTIFYSASFAANMFSGYLQAAVYTGLNGAHGLPGWRWLFIMCGVISVPGALWGFAAVPDSPWNSRAFYLTEKQRELARDRMVGLGRKPFSGVKGKTVKSMFSRPFFWVFMLTYSTFVIGVNATAYFPIYLKSRPEYTIQQVNTIPSGAYAMGLVSTIAWGQLSDRIGSRMWVALAITVTNIVSNTTLATANTKGGIIAGYVLNSATYAYGPIVIAWLSEVYTSLPDERALILGCAQAFGGHFNAWLPLVAFNVATQAPLFRAGWTTGAIGGGFQVLSIYGLRYFGGKIVRQTVGGGASTEVAA
ncbi:major facilitator superfamily transporter [Plectosphaerella cucumerina]|uniref:Major facilitator superfamily transporter n=1 Tax=Plectosphaerella cucumerina TaxID=40658 RepID=A0A8K0TJJ5_9PEZI|nr:major facilitator superfamily transporter [Plectosphaerella cucumerina]